MMHNHGSIGRKYADVGKHWVNVCRRLQTWGERMHNLGSQGTWLAFHRAIHGGRDWLELRAGTRCSSLDGFHGTWLECHGVINTDRASSSNPLRAGTQCSSLDGLHGGRDWLELRAGTRCTTLDRWASMMHNHGSQGTWLEFHRVINTDRASLMQSPAGRDSMQFPR